MSVLLVDLSSIFWMVWHATKDQEVGSACDGTIHKITRAATSNPEGGGYDHVGICVDSPPYTRKKIYPEYKAQRDEPSEVAVGQLERVKDRLTKDGYPLFAVDGAEADDVIATIVGAWADNDEIDILTGDKDLFQLVTDFVHVVSTQTGAVIDPPAVYEKTGVDASAMHGWLALVGDKSDNVPGVPGIGPKTAAKLLDCFGGDIEQIKTLAAIKDPENLLLPPLGEKLRDRLIENADNLLMSHKLVTLNSELDLDIGPLFEDRVPTTEDEPAECEAIEAEPIAQPQQTAAIVRREPDYCRQLEPETIDGAWRLARHLFESRLYTKFTNRESILAVLLRGRALGLDATTSLDAFHVIQGRPTMSADLIVGLVLNSPKCEYFRMVESDDTHATYQTRRRGDPGTDSTMHTFTIEDAGRMGLTNKDNWKKQPATMLRHRCATALARMVYPDVAGGLYDPEEIEVVR